MLGLLSRWRLLLPTQIIYTYTRYDIFSIQERQTTPDDGISPDQTRRYIRSARI